MAVARVEIQEKLLNEVNGGAYMDAEKQVIGVSKDGPLYKFTSEDYAMKFFGAIAFKGLTRLMAALMGYPDEPEEEINMQEVIDNLLKEGWIAPYNG